MAPGIQLKSARDIGGIWRSGQVASRLRSELRDRLRPGVVTAELDSFAYDFIRAEGGTPSFLNYRVGKREYPASICLSINDQVVHGVPGARHVQPGDLVSIDLGVTLGGYISDTAWTWYVGQDGVAGTEAADDDVHRLCEGTRRALYAGIQAVRPHHTVRHLSRAVQETLLEHRLGIVRDLTGHGVGFNLHEEPTIYNFDTGVAGPLLENGVVVALEPMATLGSEAVLLGSDSWTYRTADGSLAAHYEHTVALWEDRPFVLTDHHDEEARAAFAGLV